MKNFLAFSFVAALLAGCTGLSEAPPPPAAAKSEFDRLIDEFGRLAGERNRLGREYQRLAGEHKRLRAELERLGLRGGGSLIA